MVVRRPAALVSLASLTACSLAPTYHRPDIGIPAAFKEVPSGWTIATPAADGPSEKWWLAFNDPTLDRLEDQIEGSNPTLAAATARFDEAVAAVREARADLFPQIGVNGQASRDRASGNRPLALTPGQPSTYSDYQFGGSLGWEIDLFGRIRNSVVANKAEAQASAAEVRGVRLGLQTTLASAYFQLRGLDARRQLLEQTVDAYQRAFKLTLDRHRVGIASGLDTSRADTQLSSAQSELTGIGTQRAAFEHAIAALTGQPASTYSLAYDPHIPTAIGYTAATPSTLLQRRPDIDAAERRVFEANARIGVARAALYPTLSLGGQGGYQTVGPNLLSASSAFWALGPATLALSIFDGGKRRAQVHIARSEFDEASAKYKETVLNAFKEVEDDLASSRDLVTQVGQQAHAASAAARTRDLSLKLYRDGASDYLDVVTAQTAALDAERSVIELKTQQLTNSVDSIRALGGTTRQPAG